MSIQVACPCGKSFDVDDQFAGRKGLCKTCKRVLTIPIAPAPSGGRASLRPDVDRRTLDETIYDASPSMFGNHPVVFVGLILGSVVVTLGKLHSPAVWMSCLTITALIFGCWWLDCRCTRLTITRRKTTLRRGVLSKSTNEVLHSDVRNVLVSQGLMQRLFRVGSVGISTSGQSGIEIEAKGMPEPERVRELIDIYRD